MRQIYPKVCVVAECVFYCLYQVTYFCHIQTYIGCTDLERSTWNPAKCLSDLNQAMICCSLSLSPSLPLSLPRPEALWLAAPSSINHR